jgi:hypothetical protein
MSPKELVETALRILTAWTDGRKPASADLNTLKEAFYYAAVSAVARCRFGESILRWSDNPSCRDFSSRQ